MEKTCYEILEVSPDASAEAIAAAWRSMISQYHPDKVASLGREFRELAERRAKEINLAYEMLRDPERRRAYDAKLNAERARSQQQPAGEEPEPDSEDELRPEDAEAGEAVSIWQRIELRKNVWQPIKLILAGAGTLAGSIAALYPIDALFGETLRNNEDVLSYLLAAPFVLGSFALLCGFVALPCGIIIIAMDIGGRIRTAAIVIRSVLCTAATIAVVAYFIDADRLRRASAHAAFNAMPKPDPHQSGREAALAMICLSVGLIALAPRWIQRKANLLEEHRRRKQGST